MGSLKRVSYFFLGLLMMLCCLVLVIWPEMGYQFVLLILELTLLVRGIRKLVFYFVMARHMVGGINIFYRGLLYLDAGLFALYIKDMPKTIVMIYLIGCMLMNGIIDVAHASEEKKQDFKYWKYQMAFGVIKILAPLICIFFFNSMEVITAVYGVGLLNIALSHMMSAFRKTAVVYVQ